MADPHRSLGRALPLALFAVMAIAYLPTIGTDPSPDVYAADFAARHIALTGDPVPDIAAFPALDHNVIRETWIVRTADGREAVGRAPGVIAAVVPAYRLGLPGSLSAVPGGVVAALLSAATVTLLFLSVRRRAGERQALLGAGLFGLATPMWSVAADGMWPHTLTTFGIIAMAWAADRERWWLVGLCGGLVMWGRLHAGVICAVLGLGLAWVRRRPAIALRVGVASGALLALMSVWTHWMYGRWDPTSAYRVEDFTRHAPTNILDPVNFLGFWVSPDRGLLVWTPLLVVLAPGLVRGWRDLPDWSRWLLGSGGCYLVLQGLLVRFSGGDQFYGYRTSLELLACAAPALILTADLMGAIARRAFGPVALLQLVMIVPGAVVDGFYVKADDVWQQNAFVAGFGQRPAVMFTCVAATLAAAAVAVFAWRASAPRSRPPAR